MVNFFKLIYNETIKIYIQKSTWVMYILLAIIIIGSGALTASFGEITKTYSDSTWREELTEENEKLMQEMEEIEAFQEINSMLIAENNYYLEHDIKPAGYGAWHFVWENELLLSIVSLLTIIVASGIVANEFRWGTIKLLLIRPISRSTILFSKYAAVLTFALCTLLFVVIFSWITGTILFGVEGMNPHFVVEKSNGMEYVSIIDEIFTVYGLKLVNLVMMATFAFMISCLFRNSSLAIGLAVFLMMAGNSIVMFFSEHGWAKYILFANTDLSQYNNSYGPFMEGMTLHFSISVLIVYFIVFLSVAWGSFTKRDISGQ